MPVAVILTGLACGTLLAAIGLALWSGPRRVSGLSHAIRAIGWLAGALLLTGALLTFTWQKASSFSAAVPRLILMAALAAPPGIHRRRHPPWNSVMLILPSLALAWASLFLTSEPVQTGADSSPAVLLELAGIVCGGLGARALGEALSEIVASTPQIKWPSAVAYALLTLLVGGTALANLWQRGAVWGGGTEGGLAGAWLVWSAAWLGPRLRSRLRAVLTAVAASLLIVIVAGY